MFTLSMSIPRPNKLVATSILFWKSLNCWYRDSLKPSVTRYQSTNFDNVELRKRCKSKLYLHQCLKNIKSLVNTGFGHLLIKTSLGLEMLRYLSSCVIALWIAIAGKFCSTSSCDSAIHLCTDFTKIMTYKNILFMNFNLYYIPIFFSPSNTYMHN